MKALTFKLVTVVFFAGALFFYPKIWMASLPEKNPSIGNVQTFRAAYERWIVATRQNGGERKLVLSLSPIRGLSSQLSDARGTMTLDLFDGSLLVDAYRLPEPGAFDVWLVHKLPGPRHSVRPHPGDTMIKLGSLNLEGDIAKLSTRLNRSDLANFKLDAVVVTPAGKRPHDSFLLFGSPGLFQRLYYSENRGQVVRIGNDPTQNDDSTLAQVISAPFRALIPPPAHANGAGQTNLEALIADGENLFFNDNFRGNGRTCGTCHPADNNFTLNPAFIATLPPNDPLFVAEFNDDLNSEKNGGFIFEIPSLMRSKALIVENVDGFHNLESKFVMRTVLQTLSMGVSLEPAVVPLFGENPIDGSHASKVQRTGWGGDGSPGDGSLRNFIIGAITQHYPLTLKREIDVDFILPTNYQLDALEAFQLSLGRSEEFGPLPLNFKKHLTDVAAGQRIFLNDGRDLSVAAGKCNLCHENAGANFNLALLGIPGVAGLVNFNFNTGVEQALQNQIGPEGDRLRPPDGGFGTDPQGGFNNIASFNIPGLINGSFGNGTFNTPPLVEAASKGVFFHNNLVETIEEAVAFYNSQEFQDSPSGLFLRVDPSVDPPFVNPTAIDLLDFEVEQVAAFLRAINALEKIRSFTESGNKAKGANTLAGAQKHLGIAVADCQHAINVLSRTDAGLRALDNVAVAHLRASKELLEKANLIAAKTARNALIDNALQHANAARDQLVN